MKITLKKEENKTNTTAILRSHNLLEKYDFSRSKMEGVLLIVDYEVKHVKNKEWYSIDKKDVERVFNFLDKESFSIGDSDYNFTIHETGKIEIGGDLSKILSNLDEYKKDYKEFCNREHYTTVEFSL